VLQGGLDDAPPGRGQFDVVVVNGLGEGACSTERCTRWLQAAGALAAPRGFVFLIARNRFEWGRFRRFVRNPVRNLQLICHPRAYTWWGYLRLFARAGLDVRAHWVLPHGVEMLTDLVPPNRHAVEAFLRRSLLNQAPGPWRAIMDHTVLAFARSPLWNLIGGDFGFLLVVRDA
jgi:hypothetical protein